MTDWIIGVRAEHDGLRIDPCIPPHWDEFRVQRRFRGATYQITVRNPRHVEAGVTQATLDGQPLEGNLLPLPSETGEHHVEVEMG